MLDLGEKPALIIVDMENSFFREEGSMKRLGLDPEMLIPVIEPLQRIVEAGREVGLPVLYTQQCLNEDYSDGGIWIAELFPAIREARGLIRGSWDVEIIDEVKPLPNEVVVQKPLYSGFPGTDLEERLRAEDVDTVIVCGVTTECCVESTVRDAFARNFRIVVPSDATAAFSVDRHEAALEVIRFFFGATPSSEELVSAIRAGVSSNITA